jgi:hypothetical protein
MYGDFASPFEPSILNHIWCLPEKIFGAAGSRLTEGRI